jgi:26S proteasome regulatory subunit N6
VVLTKEVLPQILDMPKSKTGKIVRTLFDQSTSVEGADVQQLIALSNHIIEWCVQESRSFLRMKIQCKLADLNFQIQKFNVAIDILKELLFELKKKEDKQLLVEAQLVESKVFHSLENVPKAKASLTSVKTTAHQIYVVPHLQAEIDMMSGLIACDEKDYTTAYSYFYETFEGYRSLNDSRASSGFKYMLFSKIMDNMSDDALNLINSAVALKYQGRNVDAMKEVAQANKT